VKNIESCHPEYSNLIALAALELLEGEELDWLEAYEEAFPDLMEELKEWEEAAASFAYGTKIIPMAENLKQRLWDRLDFGTEIDRVSESELTSLRARAETVDWQPYSLDGVMLATLSFDEITREIGYFVKAVGAIRFPAHLHVSHEEIVVIEGELNIDGKTYNSGSRIRSLPNTSHQPATSQGCFLFVRTSADDRVLG
jgi:hypothetical protein